MTNNKKPQTTNFKKRTQTKPISPVMTGEIALSFAEGPVQTAIRRRIVWNGDCNNRFLHYVRLRRDSGRDEVSSLQLDTPVCMIQELLPAFAAGLALYNLRFIVYNSPL